jgi:hypothetical protein
LQKYNDYQYLSNNNKLAGKYFIEHCKEMDNWRSLNIYYISGTGNAKASSECIGNRNIHKDSF